MWKTAIKSIPWSTISILRGRIISFQNGEHICEYEFECFSDKLQVGGDDMEQGCTLGLHDC